MAFPRWVEASHVDSQAMIQAADTFRRKNPGLLGRSEARGGAHGREALPLRGELRADRPRALQGGSLPVGPALYEVQRGKAGVHIQMA